MDPLADLQALARAPLEVARDLRAIADAVRILPEIEEALRPLPRIVDAADSLPEIQEAVRSLPAIIEAVRMLPAIENLIVSLVAALEPALADVHELRGIVGSQQQQVTNMEEMMQRLDQRTVVLERVVVDLQDKADHAMELLPDPDEGNRTVLGEGKRRHRRHLSRGSLSSGSRSAGQGFEAWRRWVRMQSAAPERSGSPEPVATDIPPRTVSGTDWNNGSFRDLLESAPDAMVIVDSSWEIVLVNAQAEKLFGYRREELLGRCVETLVPERFREDYSGYRAAYSADPQALVMGTGIELCAQRKDGTEFPVEISLGPIETEEGTFVSSAIRDITERKRVERAASQFVAIVEASSDAIIGKDLEGRVVLWNRGAERLYGYTEAEMCGEPSAVLVPPGHDDEVPELIRRARAGERVEQHETVRVRKDGTLVDVSLSVSPIYDRDRNIVGIATIARDISARLRYQAQLRFLADHDSLTGTGNRRHLEREVSDQIGRARRYGEQAALLFIDVDGLKQINDAHGHKTGDRALQEIAEVVSHRLRATDVLARIGGDEFAVLLPHTDEAQAQAISKDLRHVTGAADIDLEDGTTLPLPASVGFALIDQHTDSDEILAEADQAMYQDKTRRPMPYQGTDAHPNAAG